MLSSHFQIKNITLCVNNTNRLSYSKYMSLLRIKLDIYYSKRLYFMITGLYTTGDHIRLYEIVFPRKVTHLGKLISHNVTHYHNLFNDGDNLPPSTYGSKEVHYRLTISGREYHLQLTPAYDFIGPQMVVEQHKGYVHKRRLAKNYSTKCHYRGIIQSQPDSQVVLSACDGLVS